MEAFFSQLTLDIIGKAVFNYDFDALNRDSPLLQVGTLCCYVVSSCSVVGCAVLLLEVCMLHTQSCCRYLFLTIIVQTSKLVTNCVKHVTYCCD